jgi:B9 domain-containing protein 1
MTACSAAARRLACLTLTPHHPIPLSCRYSLQLRLYKPRSASLLQTFTSWLTGMPAEFSDPKFPAYGEGREGKQASPAG